MRSIKSFRANILEKKVPKTKIRFPESSPRRCRGVVHHELPLHAVPLEQISNGFVVPRRKRAVQVDEYRLPSKLYAEKRDHLFELFGGRDLEFVLFQNGRIPDRPEEHDDLHGSLCGWRWREKNLTRGRRGRIHTRLAACRCE